VLNKVPKNSSKKWPEKRFLFNKFFFWLGVFRIRGWAYVPSAFLWSAAGFESGLLLRQFEATYIFTLQYSTVVILCIKNEENEDL
jgi:hypothetical protein